MEDAIFGLWGRPVQLSLFKKRQGDHRTHTFSIFTRRPCVACMDMSTAFARLIFHSAFPDALRVDDGSGVKKRSSSHVLAKQLYGHVQPRLRERAQLCSLSGNIP
jgi:hypothetical protein